MDIKSWFVFSLCARLLAGCSGVDDRLLWKFSVHELRFWQGYCSGGTPVIDNGLAYYSGYYFFSEKPVVYGVDLKSGEKKFTLPDANLLAVHQNILLINKDLPPQNYMPQNELTALDLQTKRSLWNKRDLTFRMVKDGCVYAWSREGNILGIDLRTGRELWNVDLKPSIPSIAGPKVPWLHIDGENLILVYDGGIWSIAPLLKKVTSIRSYANVDFNAGALSKDGNLLVASDGKSKRVIALDLDSRKVKWTLPYYTSSPAAFNRNLVYLDGNPMDQKLRAIDRETGKVVWTFLRGGQGNVPLLHEGVLYYAGHYGLHALDPFSGKELWQVNVRNCRGNLAASDHAIYFGSEDCHLYAVKIR